MVRNNTSYWRRNEASALFLLLMIVPATMRAQGEGSISGTVTDATGAVIAGANIKVRSSETGMIRSLQTDAAGRYEAPLLAVGRYEVNAEKDGFQTTSRTGISKPPKRRKLS